MCLSSCVFKNCIIKVIYKTLDELSDFEGIIQLSCILNENFRVLVNGKNNCFMDFI